MNNEDRQQHDISSGNVSDVGSEIRRQISNITETASNIAATHFEYTRREAGLGVVITSTWALANAIWKLALPGFNATAMGTSSYSDASTTFGMTVIGGMLGNIADIGTSFMKRKEVSERLHQFIDVIQDAKNQGLDIDIHYKKSLKELRIPLESYHSYENIQEVWNDCVEMEIKVGGYEKIIKISNVDKLFSKYMLLHSIATVTSLSMYAASVGITGYGLHQIISKSNKTIYDSSLDENHATISAAASNTIAALGTLPIVTFTNWFTTLCLQQEKQIAEISKHLFVYDYEKDPRGHNALIDLLANLAVYKPSETIEMVYTNPSAGIALSILDLEHQGHNFDAVVTQTSVENAVVNAAKEIDLSSEELDNIVEDIGSLFESANEIIELNRKFNNEDASSQRDFSNGGYDADQDSNSSSSSTYNPVHRLLSFLQPSSNIDQVTDSRELYQTKTMGWINRYGLAPSSYEQDNELELEMGFQTQTDHVRDVIKHGKVKDKL